MFEPLVLAVIACLNRYFSLLTFFTIQFAPKNGSLIADLSLLHYFLR
jgi:hypothetical protein